MATALFQMYPSLLREVNPPGFEQYPDMTPADGLGYLEDGFWEGRLSGLFTGYTVKDGASLDEPTEDGLRYVTGSADSSLPEDYQMLIVILAGYRLIHRKALTLASNLRAQAGPVEYEIQTSATVLREILQGMERRLREVSVLHSDTISSAAFYYMDAVAQSAYSMANGLAELAVLY